MDDCDFDQVLERNSIMMKKYITQTNCQLNHIRYKMANDSHHQNIPSPPINDNNNENISDDSNDDSFDDKVKQIYSGASSKKIKKEAFDLQSQLSKEITTPSYSKPFKKKKGIHAKNPLIVQYQNQISKLKMTIAKLENENNSLKSLIKKEKDKSEKYREISNSIICHYTNK